MSRFCHRSLPHARVFLILALVLTGVLAGPARPAAATANITYNPMTFTLLITVDGPTEAVQVSEAGGIFTVSSNIGTTADTDAQTLGFAPSTGANVGNSTTGANFAGVVTVQIDGVVGGNQTVTVLGGAFPALLLNNNLESATFNTAPTSASVQLAATASGPVTVNAAINPTNPLGAVSLTSTASTVSTTATIASGPAASTVISATGAVSVGAAISSGGDLSITSTGSTVTTNAPIQSSAATPGYPLSVIANGAVSIGGTVSPGRDLNITSTTSTIVTTADINAGPEGVSQLTANGNISLGGVLNGAGSPGYLTVTSTTGTVNTTGANGAINAVEIFLKAATGIGSPPNGLKITNGIVEALTTAGGNIFLNHTQNLAVGNPNAPNLFGSNAGIRVTGGNGTITLVSANDIYVERASKRIAAAGDILLQAYTANPVIPQIPQQNASGSIFTNQNVNSGTSAIQSTAGKVTLVAGLDINLGGNFLVQACCGAPNPPGGDVRAATGLSMQAGRDITIWSPTVAESGGTSNLTVDAGRTVQLIFTTSGPAPTAPPVLRSTSTGPIQVTTPDTGSVVLAARTVVSTTLLATIQSLGAPVTITTGDPQLGGTVNAGGGQVTVKSPTAPRPLDLGSNPANTTGLDNNEVRTVAAGTLRVGDPTHTGALTVSSLISPTAALQDLVLVNAGPINVNAALQSTRNVSITTGVTGTVSVASTIVAPQGAVAINSGGPITVTAAGDIQAANGFAQTGAGPVQTAGDVSTVNNPISYAAPVTITGSLALNAGTAAVSFANTLAVGANTLTVASSQPVALGGNTSINGGTLAAPAGANLAAGKTLSGVGTITGPLNVAGGGAAVSPGNSPGILNTGGLTMTTGSGLNIELAGTSPGTGYDQVNVTGTVNLGGATLNLSSTVVSPTVGTQYTIIANDGTDPVVGTFAGLAEGATLTAGGATFRVSYVGGTGNDVVLTAAQAAGPTGLGNLRFVNPVRVVDTRGAPFAPIGYTPGGQQVTAGQLQPGTITRFKIGGQTFGAQSIPADATGVLINVTIVQSQASGGFVTVFPGDVATPPNASTVNPSTAIAANFWTVGLPTSGGFAGTIAVNNVGAARDILVDLVGYYSPTAPSIGNLRFVSPVRVLDTRPDSGGPIGVNANGTPVTAGQLAPGQTQKYRLSGQSFASNAGTVAFPADVTGILAHVTIVQSQASGGYTTLLPGDATGVPGTSTVNPSTATAFNAWAIGIPTTGLDAGTFGVYTTNQQHVIVDVVGYFAPSNPNTVGELTLVSPQRVVDTRASDGAGTVLPIGFDENGAPITAGTLPAGATRKYSVGGRTFGPLSVPSDVRGGLMNVTIVQDQPSGGFLTVFPGDAAPPNASTVNPATAIAASFWASGIPVAPASFPGTLGVNSVGYPRHVVIDLLGYYR